MRSASDRVSGQIASREFVLQNRSEWDELAPVKQFRKPCFHLIDIAVVSQARLQRSCDSRLLRIDFPGMQINQDRATIRLDDPASRPSVKPHWQVAKGASATSGKIATQHSHCHWRYFAKSLRIIDLPAEREPWRVGDPVQVVQYRVHAGIVQKTLFGENWYSPESLTNNRKRRGTIRDRSISTGVCDCCDRTSRIGAKFVWGEAMYAAMEETVATDLVAGGANLADELRVKFGNPSQHKECSVRVEPREKFEKPASIVNDATGKIEPGLRFDLTCEGFDVKIIFYVYAEAVQLRFIHRVSILAVLRRAQTPNGDRCRHL